jgi:hypothetical protein
MEVIIDGSSNFEFEVEPKDVFEAIGVISEQLHSNGRSLMSIELDGEGIFPDKLDEKTKEKPLSVVNQLIVSSEETNKLVKDCLTELESVLPNLPIACQELAQLFQSQTPESGYEPLQQLITIWSVVKEREIMIANALDISAEDLDVGGQSMEAIHGKLNKFLQEACDALKASDSVLLGDLFEYELAPLAELDADIVACLKEKFTKQTP